MEKRGRGRPKTDPLRRELAIRLRAEGKTYREIAKALGYNEHKKTMWRLLVGKSKKSNEIRGLTDV